MIKTNNLTKYFKDFRAVDQLNITVNTGEVLALLGPNGAGKTTTVRMLTTVLKPSRGTAQVAGFDVLKDPDRVRSAVGVLTEDHGLYDRMYIEEYLDFYGQTYGIHPEKRKRRIDFLIAKFNLEEAVNRRIGKYSKGMRQKLSLARALLHEPPVLLLDEPTSAMDPASARLVRNAIKTLRSEERTIIVCTHNLAEAEDLADTIAIIRDGRIIAHGSPQVLKNQLLGPSEFLVRMSHPLDGQELPLPRGVKLISRGDTWFTVQTEDAQRDNPVMLKNLISADLSVVSIAEIQRSLESVYLKAVGETDIQGLDNV